MLRREMLKITAELLTTRPLSCLLLVSPPLLHCPIISFSESRLLIKICATNGRKRTGRFKSLDGQTTARHPFTVNAEEEGRGQSGEDEGDRGLGESLEVWMPFAAFIFTPCLSVKASLHILMRTL